MFCASDGAVPGPAFRLAKKRDQGIRSESALGVQPRRPRDQPEESALAGSVSSDHAEGLPGSDLQREVAERLEFVEGNPPLETADGVFLQGGDLLPRDPVSDGRLFDPDRRHERKANSSAWWLK